MKSHHMKTSRRNGFALIATILLMVLLAIITIGTLSLSVVTLRTGNQDSAQARARANARMALMIAIGELQKSAGSDTRVTASADILDPTNPPLTGVWKSWEGSDHEAFGATLAGRPRVPAYLQKKDSAASSGRFLAWLVSSNKPTSVPGDAASLVQKTPSASTVPLVASGSLASGDDRQVHVVPVPVSAEGTYAWWISGENQKARIPRPSIPKNDDAVSWTDLVRSHAVADPTAFELDSLLTDPTPANKAFTRNTADLFAKANALIKPSQSFHDLSATSIGLLTNTATGGWRKDLSLLTENWSTQPTTGLEFFKISPTKHLSYTRPASDAEYRVDKSMLYHWADYRPWTREFWIERGSIASWARIQKYATLYKKMTPTTASSPNINCQSWPDNGGTSPFRDAPRLSNANNIFNNVRIMPQMARLQMIVSHYATAVGAAPGNLRPAVLYTPVVTLWNPYNTRITLLDTLVINPANSLPLALRYRLTGTGAPSLTSEYWAVQGPTTITSELPVASRNYANKYIGVTPAGGVIQEYRLRLNQNPLILEPGETRIFSPAAASLVDVSNSSGPTIDLFPGYRSGGGVFYTLDRRLTASGSAISLPATVSMEADAKFDVVTANKSATWNQDVCGTTYQWFLNSTGVGSGRSHSWFSIYYKKSDADALYPPKLGLASATLAQCASNPVPFLSLILGSRIANYKATATKGMVQADPVVDFFSSNAYHRFTDVYPGNDTLINTPWDFSVVEHTSGGDDMLPNVDNTNGGLTQWDAFTTTNFGAALGLNKLGVNTLTLDQANNYAGATTVSAGALNIRNATALGTTAAGTTVASGAALEIQGGITVGAEALTLNGTGISNGGALRNISGDNIYGGAITLGSASLIRVDADTLTLNGVIGGGTNTLTKEGVGLLTLGAANTYTGLTTVDGGELRWAITNALSSGGLTVNNGGTVNMQTFTDTVGTITLAQGGSIIGTTGTLTTTAFVSNNGGSVSGFTTGALNLDGSTSAFTYNDTIVGSTTLNINRVYMTNNPTFNIARGDDVSGIDFDITDVLYTDNNGRSIIKTGDGVMRLSGSTASTGNGNGTMTIQNGTLIYNKSAEVNAYNQTGLITIGDTTGSAGSAILRYTTSSNQILNNAITVLSDGLFDLNGFSETTSGALTVNGGSITTGAGTLSLGNATNTISGASTVTGNLTFSGTAATNLTLGGTASINGTTTFSGGNGSGITATGNTTIAGILTLGTNTRAIAVTNASDVLTISASTSGTGVITKSGAGTLLSKRLTKPLLT